eukprot:TRINITY_DN17654_c0_g1_i1.p1 TRINITY_DN17654_c0_g1~~TRINITY_DN17654_c0_g1_i1.p1  ORF type:complete len:205 (+),score=50.49 TRINITY_DN17654_c0_g1_i1:70-684(+)
MSLPPELQQNLTTFKDSITALEEHVKVLSSLPPLKEISERAQHVETAKLNATLAYALDSLYFMYLKSVGIPTDTHPVKKELERVKVYMQKIKAATEEQKEPRMVVDKGAADRFVRHALNQPKERSNQGAQDMDTEKEDSSSKRDEPSTPTAAPRGPIRGQQKKSELLGTARSLTVPTAPHLAWEALQKTANKDEMMQKFLKQKR